MTNFDPGVKRRQIEDSIVARFRQVDLDQPDHDYLEDEAFWDFVFSWYELVRYYENHADTSVGAHMLDLFARCGTLFRAAATDRNLRERQRDKAADALYQITYYVNQMLIQVERNALSADDPVGSIGWKNDAPDEPNRLN